MISEINYLHKIYWVIFTQLLHISCMQIPFIQNVLSTQPVSFDTWLELAIIAIGLVIVMEIDKWLMLKKKSV